MIVILIVLLGVCNAAVDIPPCDNAKIPTFLFDYWNGQEET